MAEVQSNDGSREHSTFASVGEYICTLAIFFGYYIVGDSIHFETCTYMYIKQISALQAEVFTDFSLYFSAFFEKLGLIWCWIIFPDSSGILSHLGAIDRTLLPVDDALTNARRDLLERTVSASSSLYSACSVVSLTRLNHIISRPEKIGRAHVWTPVTRPDLVCRLLLEKKKKISYYTIKTASIATYNIY